MGLPSEKLEPILGELNLKWIALNDKYKKLQVCLTEANRKNEELEMKLAQSLDQVSKVEQENKRLNVILKKLHEKFFTGSLHQLISALKQNIRAYDECILPSLAELTKSVTDTDNDQNTSSNEDEGDSCCLSVFESRKPPSVQPVQSDRLRTVIALGHQTKERLRVIAERSNTRNKPILKISSSSVVTSCSTTAEYSKTPVILNTSSSADQRISSTTPLIEKCTSEQTETEPSTIPTLNVVIADADIESFCAVEEEEEQILDSGTVSPVVVNSTDSTHQAIPIFDKDKNCVSSIKRPFSPSLNDLQTSSKRFARELKYSPASSSSDTQLKCLICEYENLEDTNNAFKDHFAIDQHIIKNHPNPHPCYKRCMLNNGTCTRHFHPKQDFNCHVKLDHSNENPDSSLLINQGPLRCATCGVLFLFKSDLKEHDERVHGSNSGEKKATVTIFRGNSSRQIKMVECELCKRQNRLSVQYRLYDELDAHLMKCHPDPSPDYLRCPYCIRHFKVPRRLELHIINKHPKSYSIRPLEKFMPSIENAEETNEQNVTNSMNTERNVSISTSTEAHRLKILSPRSINRAILNDIVKSIPLPST